MSLRLLSIASAALIAFVALRAPAPLHGPADGKAVYTERCATCHGPDGGGDGPLAKELKYRPRAFKDGRFAFGDTVESMTKTLLSGIPGEEQARMPPFKAILSDDEIAAVITYVRTLMPLRPESAEPAGMKMEWNGEPRIARGILPPLREGEGPLARGLLAGLPSGTSFEYATDSLRLVALRRGDFLTRTDWLERGGKPLTPLGAAIWTGPTLRTWAPFLVAEPLASGAAAGARPAFAPATVKLRETSTLGGALALKSDLVDGSGRLRAHVLERPRDIALRSDAAVGGSAFVQEFELIAADEPVAIDVSLALACDPALSLRRPDEPEEGEAKRPSGVEATVRHSFEQIGLRNSTGCWVTRGPDGAFVLVRIEAPSGAQSGMANGATVDVVDVTLTVGAEPALVRRTLVVARGDSGPDELVALAHELGAK